MSVRSIVVRQAPAGGYVWGLLGLFALVALFLTTQATLPSMAGAHAGHAHSLIDKLPNGGRIPGQPDFKKVGKTTYRFLPGRAEYEIDRPGRPDSFVHADFELSSEDSGGPDIAAAFAGGTVGLPTGETAPVCRSSGNRIVIVYTHRPADKTPTPTEELRGIVRQMNWKIVQQSSEASGGSHPVHMVVDCSGGAINVYDVATNDNTPFTIFTAASSVPNQLFGEPTGPDSVRYLIFDHESNPKASGYGEVSNDASKSSANANAYYTQSGVVYGNSWGNHTASHITVHELLHTLGAAQGFFGAPYGTSSGKHCTDGFDVLCYNDGSKGGEKYSTTRCPSGSGYDTPEGVQIDCGRDTYFSGAPEAGTWLATHWDVAGIENPFLAYRGAPTVSTQGAELLPGAKMRLKGLIYPNTYETTYQFEYGPTTSYGSKVPVSAKSIGDGYVVNVSEESPSLTEGATYHARLTATNSAGTSHGEDISFTVKRVPILTTESATDTYWDAATLHGKVNPNGSSTSYWFEYGKTTSYGSKVPLAGKGIGSAVEDVKVSDTIEGLSPGTTYHFRVVATSVKGTSFGEDETFTTLKPQWTLQSTPDPSGNVKLQDVSCASESECVAVGSNGTASLAQRWSGGEWSTMTSPAEGFTLGDVSCGSTSSCLALSGTTTSSTTLKAQRWNGSEWSVLTAPMPSGATNARFTGVSCTSATFCMAVGYKGILPAGTLAEIWNGSEWTVLTPPSEGTGGNYLSAVSCTSSISCTAIGKVGTKVVALRWNGSEWSTLAAPKEASSSTSADLSCTAANACTALPTAGAKVEHWNGTEWTSTTVPTPAGGSAVSVKGVSCASAISCIAVGSYTKESKTLTLGERWSGSEWSVQETPNHPEGGGGLLAGVSCISVSKCTAAGYYQSSESKTLAERYGLPPTVTAEAASSVNAYEATLNGTVNPEGSATGYWFEYGTMIAWEKNEPLTKIPLTGKEIGSGISNVAVSQMVTDLEPNTLYVFRVVAESPGGMSMDQNNFKTSAEPQWALQSTPNPSGKVKLQDVSCASESECVAVGSNGTASLAQRWSGGEWSTMTSPAEGFILGDVSCGSTDSCLAFSGTPSASTTLKVQRWNGSAWSVITAPMPSGATYAKLTGVSCTSATFCMAVGYKGSLPTGTLAETWNGTEWAVLTPPSEGTVNYLSAVSCTSSISCTAIGKVNNKAAALRWNGSEWSTLAAPKETSAPASADLACTADDACTALPTAGAKVERWNGTEWTSTTVPTPAGGSAVLLKGVSCASTVCMAVGSYTKEGKTVTLAEHWDGSAWSVQATPNHTEGGGVLVGVECLSAAHCTAAGYYEPKSGEAKTLAARYE